MLEVLDSKRVRELNVSVARQFGVEFEGAHIFLSKREDDGEKIFLYSGRQVPTINCEWIGLNIGVQTSKGFCPTIEGAQLLGKRAKMGVVSVLEGDVLALMSGEELSIPSSENGFVLLRTGDMFFGTGFIEDGRVKLLIPASRQIGDRV